MGKKKLITENVVVDPVSGCWIWQGARDDHGYGALTIDYAVIRAHRLMARVWYGTPLKGRTIVVRHTCDNPPCINPTHLMPGTQAENMLDCADKGRIANSKKTVCKAGHLLSGSNLNVITSKKGRIHRQCRACAKIRTQNFIRKKHRSRIATS